MWLSDLLEKYNVTRYFLSKETGIGSIPTSVGVLLMIVSINSASCLGESFLVPVLEEE